MAMNSVPVIFGVMAISPDFASAKCNVFPGWTPHQRHLLKQQQRLHPAAALLAGRHRGVVGDQVLGGAGFRKQVGARWPVQPVQP